MLRRISSFDSRQMICVVTLLGVWGCGGSDASGLFGKAGSGNVGGAGSSGDTSTPAGAGTASGGGGSSSVAGSGASAGSAAGGGGSGGQSGAPNPEGGMGGVISGGGTSGGVAGTDPGGSGGTSGGKDTGGAGGSGGDEVGGTGGTTGGTGGCTSSDEVCDGLDNDCDSIVDDGRTCKASCEGFAIGDHGYMYCNNPTGLNMATEACEEEGMRLAWVETAEENAALVTAMAEFPMQEPGPGGDPGVRIGGSDADEEGRWSWIGGSAFWQGDDEGMAVGGAYVNWAMSRPNNAGFGGEDCLVMLVEDVSDGEAGEWNDVPCMQQQPFVCERP